MIQKQDRIRLFAVGLGVIFLFCLLAAHYYQIQIVEGDKWVQEANKQHFFYVKEPFTRGTFYSNSSIKKGHPEKDQKLVVDIEKFHLYIDPESIPEKNKREIALELVRQLDLSKEEVAPLWRQFFKKSRSRKLAVWLDADTKEAILTWWQPYAKKTKIPRNALYFVTDYQRSYPFGKLLGQVLHTVQSTKDERSGQAYPTGGLELHFDRFLRGNLGKRRLMRSPRNAIETGEVIAYPENGADIYLTINHTLQAIAEEEIEKGVKKFKAKAGWAVMMEPRTGEILALAQYPFFQPAEYQQYFNDPLMIEHTKVKAITDANEVGSVMKAITLAVALLANKELASRGEKPLFGIEEKIAASNGKFPGRSKPITDTHLHYYLNMDMALQHSSNIYVARLAERIIDRLGADWYRHVLQDIFGFGLKTGIELPSESSGLLPTPGKRHPNGTFEWSTPTPFSLAFGHNLQANSLQILRAVAVIANGGYLVQPTLLRSIPQNENFKQSAAPLRVIDQEIAERVARAMKFTTKRGGTARRADIWGYSEAGKSSTPKKIINGAYSETRYVPNFLGFAPAKEPTFILLVTMDEPEYDPWTKSHNGGVCCGQVFREIGRRSLEYLGIAPDDPYGYPSGDPRHDPNNADWLPETKKLGELYDKWNNKSAH